MRLTAHRLVTGATAYMDAQGSLYGRATVEAIRRRRLTGATE